MARVLRSVVVSRPSLVVVAVAVAVIVVVALVVFMARASFSILLDTATSNCLTPARSRPPHCRVASTVRTPIDRCLSQADVARGWRQDLLAYGRQCSLAVSPQATVGRWVCCAGRCPLIVVSHTRYRLSVRTPTVSRQRQALFHDRLCEKIELRRIGVVNRRPICWSLVLWTAPSSSRRTHSGDSYCRWQQSCLPKPSRSAVAGTAGH